MNFISKRKKNLLLWLSCSIVFIEAYDVSVVNLALPAIADDLHTSLVRAQWIQTVYIISFGGFLLLGGRMCDSFGDRIVFLSGILLFAIASAFIVFSKQFFILLFLRGVQGLGAALGIPAGMALLSRYFEDTQERNRAFGIFGSFAAVGFASGLALGGIVTTHFNWHWIFGITIPYIAVVCITGALFVPKESAVNKVSLNVISAVWLVLNLLFACYTIHALHQIKGWNIISIFFLALSFTFLVRFDRSNVQPFFHVALFQNKQTVYGQLASFILGASFLSTVFITTLALRHNFALTTREIGLLLFPFSLFSAIVSIYFLPIAFRKLGIRRTARLSMLLMLAGIALLFFAVAFSLFPLILLSILCINSLSISTAYPALTVLTVSAATPGFRGTAAGLQSTLYTIGSSIGLTVIGLLLQANIDQGSLTPIDCCCLFVGLLTTLAIFLLSKKH